MRFIGAVIALLLAQSPLPLPPARPKAVKVYTCLSPNSISDQTLTNAAIWSLNSGVVAAKSASCHGQGWLITGFTANGFWDNNSSGGNQSVLVSLPLGTGASCTLAVGDWSGAGNTLGTVSSYAPTSIVGPAAGAGIWVRPGTCTSFCWYCARVWTP